MRALLLLAAAKALVPTLPTPRRASVRTFVSMAADKKDDVAVVILAGGTGSRMKADRPKQFLDLLGKPVLQWDLELLLGIDDVRILEPMREGHPELVRKGRERRECP